MLCELRRIVGCVSLSFPFYAVFAISISIDANFLHRQQTHAYAVTTSTLVLPNMQILNDDIQSSRCFAMRSGFLITHRMKREKIAALRGQKKKGKYRSDFKLSAIVWCLLVGRRYFGVRKGTPRWMSEKAIREISDAELLKTFFIAFGHLECKTVVEAFSLFCGFILNADNCSRFPLYVEKSF